MRSVVSPDSFARLEPYASELDSFLAAWTVYMASRRLRWREWSWNHFPPWTERLRRNLSIGSLDYNFNEPRNVLHTEAECQAVLAERRWLQDAGLWAGPNGWENFEPEHYADGCLCGRTRSARTMGMDEVGAPRRRWDLE